MKSILSGQLAVLKDYCMNCSIAGLSYIVNPIYHYTERLFWMGCFVFALIGAVHLVEDTMEEFSEGVWNMVVENVRPLDRVDFPAVGICEFGDKESEFAELFEYIQGMAVDDDPDYGNLYDILDFLSIVFFQNLYSSGSYSAHCKMYNDAPDKVQCPKDNFVYMSSLARLNCTQLLSNCKWMGRPFECRQYFRPLSTAYGTCFLLNSLQATQKHGPHWLDMSMGRDTGPGTLEMEYSAPITIILLNEEDIPHPQLKQVSYEHRQQPELSLWFRMKTVINDDGIRTIKPESRKCLFPDEPFEMSYNLYSFSVCITECLKAMQMAACNCTHINLVYDDDDQDTLCDYDGLICIDSKRLVKPSSALLMPWNENGCDCLPSCAEHELNIVGTQLRDAEKRSSIIKLINLPSQRYRRYYVKGNLDFVVAIGGILSLFLGASILTVVECFYFFTVRVWGTAWQNRHKDAIK